jgi:hypothetical protein
MTKTAWSTMPPFPNSPLFLDAGVTKKYLSRIRGLP